MTRSAGSGHRRSVLVALAGGAALIALGLHPAEADVTAVKGSALGFFADNISLFGGGQPDAGPTPKVTLAGDASNSPQNGSAPTGVVQFPPAVLFTSDTITVGSSGSVGATGGVSSTSSIDNINKATSQSVTGGEIFTADNLSGTATASQTGVTGSTTVTNGKVSTHSNDFNCTSLTTPCGGHTHDAASPEGQVPVPANPAPNTRIAGHVHLNDTTTDYFVIVFNEQITNADGSLTVNPVHEYFGAKLSGDSIVDDPTSILQGDLYLGQVSAGLTASGTGGTTGTAAPGDTTTTEAGGTTTTLEPGATTTTEPGATPTTTAAGTPGPPGTPSGGTTGGAAGTASTPAGAGPKTITEVAGGAYGYYTNVSLFGGPKNAIGPAPSVTLPKTGASPALTATAPSGIAQYGPATIFGGKFVEPGRNPSGPLTVGTGGKTGPGGFVTSSASVVNVGPGPVVADRLSSTCRADENGVTGSTTVTKGVAETSYDKQTQEPKTKVDIPVNPAPNMTVEGTLDHIGDRYRIVYNEIQRSPGAITVNAVHMYLLGPVAVGDMIVGQVRCATTAAAFVGAGGASRAGGGTTVSGAAGTGVAATGFETRAWLAVALLLLVSGAGAVLWSRRRPVSIGPRPPNVHGR